MAFTRKKNLPSEYNLEMNQYHNSRNYMDYKSKYQSNQPAYPGFGLTPTQLPGTNLSSNYITVESQLFGINANNLVNPEIKEKSNDRNYPFWNITPKNEAILPKPLVIEKYQRPLYCYKEDCK